MKTVEGFRLRKLGNEHIIVGEGLAQINFNKMISLNDTAAYLWESVVGKEFTAETLTDLLCERYEVDRERAEADAAALVEKWLEAGIVEQ